MLCTSGEEKWDLYFVWEINEKCNFLSILNYLVDFFLFYQYLLIQFYLKVNHNNKYMYFRKNKNFFLTLLKFKPKINLFVSISWIKEIFSYGSSKNNSYSFFSFKTYILYP